jgi:hypothetical protein
MSAVAEQPISFHFVCSPVPQEQQVGLRNPWLDSYLPPRVIASSIPGPLVSQHIVIHLHKWPCSHVSCMAPLFCRKESRRLFKRTKLSLSMCGFQLLTWISPGDTKCSHPHLLSAFLFTILILCVLLTIMIRLGSVEMANQVVDFLCDEIDGGKKVVPCCCPT